MKAYKIRHKETGLFSTGGMTPRWRKLGKTWTAKQHINSHLGLLDAYQYAEDPYQNAELVEYDVIECYKEDLAI